MCVKRCADALKKAVIPPLQPGGGRERAGSVLGRARAPSQQSAGLSPDQRGVAQQLQLTVDGGSDTSSVRGGA
jgi:hypothetical protein